MKISELAQIGAIRRDVRLPLEVAGQNLSITLGQIMDATAQHIVAFGGIVTTTGSETTTTGSTAVEETEVVYDSRRGGFYNRARNGTAYVYYASWATYASYYGDDGSVRRDCLFVTTEGRLYAHNGTTLIRAGIIEDEAKQIQLATAIEVADEEEMERRIAAGEYEDGQLYFTAEEE